MAFVVPLLLLLIFGVIELGWLFAQNLEVRHGAREGARLAAVNFPEGPSESGTRSTTNSDTLVAEICGRMQTVTAVTVSLTSSGAVGDPATVEVEALNRTLSGLLDWAIPPGISLTSEVDVRLDQGATWANTSDQTCP